MSQKSKRNQTSQAHPLPPLQQTPQASRMGRRSLFIAAAVCLLIAFVVATLLYKSEKAKSAELAVTANTPALTRDHAPTLGRADAKVHIVEFLDPACETCREFYPFVKSLMAANPERIRLSVRHVAFHTGSDYVVRVLEAARKQGKYWQTLEALLASQSRWAINHTVRSDLVMARLDGLGLNLEQLNRDLNDPQITRAIEQDLADARSLNVTKTPGYFVNGRQMPTFGYEQLKELIAEELKRAYP
ncbi:MAG: DsbA family protein [Rubrivivax sp.]